MGIKDYKGIIKDDKGVKRATGELKRRIQG